MREFNALRGYPEPKVPRVVSPDGRTLRHKLIACERGREFYDGDRSFGYGGLKYDGRWVPIAKNICDEYGITASSRVLQIGCDKGFLLHDIGLARPGVELHGVEISPYARDNALSAIRDRIRLGSFSELPFDNGYFDLIIAIGAVYTLTLRDAVRCVREMERVGKGKSFITLGSYETPQDLKLFKMWSLLGSTVLTPDEWREVLTYSGYRGDYTFVNARTLNLVEAPSK